MRVTKGDITIECADQAELEGALLALSATQSDFHPLPGVHIPGGDCSLGAAELGEFISADEEQRLRLVEPLPLLRQIEFPPPMACGPAGDPGTDMMVAGEIIQAPPEHPAPQYVPVSRCCLDVLEIVLLFPEGVYAKGIAELLGISPKSKAVGGRLQKLATMGLVEHPEHNRNLWRATYLARRSKLVAC